MLLKTRGIIVRSVKYSETSVITDVLTEEKGLRSYIVSGVRSKKARIKAGLLQLMSIVDLVVYHRDDKDLTRMKEVQSAYVYQSVPFDVVKGSIGLFMTEIIQKTIKEREENRPLFDAILSYYQFLDKTPHSVANIPLHFLVELSSFLGFTPSETASAALPYFDIKEGVFVKEMPNHIHCLDKDLSFILHALLHLPKEEIHLLKINKSQRKHLLNKLLDYYKFRVENMQAINAHLILQEVLG